MAARRIDGIDGLTACVGQHLGYSDWLEVSRTRAAQFVGSAGDDASRPDATAAPDFLVLSLTPVLLPQVVEISGFPVGVNYGCSQVRFLTPVAIGEQVRIGVDLLAADPIAGGVAIEYRLTFEVRGADDPGCVADVLFRFYS